MSDLGSEWPDLVSGRPNLGSESHNLGSETGENCPVWNRSLSGPLGPLPIFHDDEMKA